MLIQRKSNWRLLIVLVLFVVLTGVGAGVYVVRKDQLRDQEVQLRIEAMSDVRKGNDFAAMHKLGKFINSAGDDPEALYAYAKARRAVVEPNGGHLTQAIGVFRRVLEMQPNHPTARNDLLELYLEVGFASETLELAELLLKTNGNDAVAMNAKAVALLQMRRFDQALAVSQECNELRPFDHEGQVRTLVLMQELSQSHELIVARAKKLLETHAEDPRFEVLLGFAHGMTRDDLNAAQLYRQAAERPSPDGEFTLRLVKLLESVGDFEIARRVLERDMATMAAPGLQRAVVQRLWQANRLVEVVDRLSDIDPQERESDSELLAMKALSLIQLHRREEADHILVPLRERHDRSAVAWVHVLDSVFAVNPDAKQAMEACQKALTQQPGQPCFHFFLASVHASIGNDELALKTFSNAAVLAPNWPAPVLAAIKTLLAANRTEQALAIVGPAQQRWPRNVDAAVYFILAWFANIQEDETDRAKVLLEMVDRLQQAVPGESRTLPVRVALMARIGRKEEAGEQLRQMLEAKPPPGELALVQLARTSDAHGLGLAEACFELSRATWGLSPGLAFAQALGMARRGNGGDGHRFLLKHAGEQGGDNDLAWRLAVARYLETIGNPEAAAAWKALAQDRTTDNRVQQWALKAHSTRADRQFIDDVIDRVRQLGGQESPTWRIVRARWLLDRDEKRETALEAANLLDEVVAVFPKMLEARLLLAHCHQRQGDIEGALAQLSIAQSIDSASDLVALEQARTLRTQGNHAGALAALGRIEVAKLTPDQRRRAAVVLAETGRIDRAIALLHGDGDGDGVGGDLPADLFLAVLYRRQGQFDKTEAICQKLMERPDAATIEFTADFLATIGRMQEAEAVLLRLDELKLDAGLPELARATFASRHDGLAQAMDHFHQAIEAASTRPAPHLAMMSFLVTNRRSDDAVTALKEAVRLIPDDVHLQFISQHKELLGVDLVHVGSRPVDCRPLVATMLANLEQGQIAAEALTHLQDASDDKEWVSSLRSLADRHLLYLPLQNVVARVYLNLDDPDQAATVAMRAMQSFTHAIEPAAIAAEAHATAGRWAQARTAALRWQDRSAQPVPAAEVIIAEAHMKLGNADGAVVLTKSHLQDAMAEPDRNVAILVRHARALIGAGQIDEAKSFLWPLLDRSVQYREAWIWLAINTLADDRASVLWLEKIEPIIEAGSLRERLALAQGWQTVGIRSQNRTCFEKGREVLLSVAASDDAPVKVLFGVATFEELMGNLEQAAEGYRRVLGVDPDLAAAQNNLAMLLIRMDTQLDEALERATSAVKSRSKNASYRDTLALVQAKVSKFDSAIANMKMAMRLEPANAMWAVNLAQIYLDSGNVKEARSTLAPIARSDLDGQGTPEDVRQRWAALTSRLADIDPLVERMPVLVPKGLLRSKRQAVNGE